MKKLFAFLISAAMVLSFSACSSDSSGEYPVKIAGTTFNETPSTVVCLSDSIADILIACGYGSRISAKSEECTQEELEDVPTVGTKENPSIKKITDMSPSVVFTDKSVSSEAVKELRENDVNVLNMISASNGDELTVLYQSISAVMGGNITGRENGENKAKSILVTMDDLQRIVPQSDIPIKACYLYNADGEAAYDGSFSGHLFSYANVINVCVDDYSGKSVIDAVVLSDPQYIFCDIGVKSQIMENENFKNVSAVKQNNVYEIDSNLFLRQGYSITEVLSFIIEKIYPEVNTSSPDDNNENSVQSSSALESSQPEISEEESSKIEADNSLEITDDMSFGQGDENDDIMKIQQRLKDLGYFHYEDITNYYGALTAEAFMAFEENNNLEADGYATAEDLRLLFSDKVNAAAINEETEESYEATEE